MIEISEKDVKTLLLALDEATESAIALLDCYTRSSWDTSRSKYIEGSRKVVRLTKDRIARYKEIARRLVKL